jgi:hypothetical protein
LAGRVVVPVHPVEPHLGVQLGLVGLALERQHPLAVLRPLLRSIIEREGAPRRRRCSHPVARRGSWGPARR